MGLKNILSIKKTERMLAGYRVSITAGQAWKNSCPAWSVG
jgi:hypothetical protein